MNKTIVASVLTTLAVLLTIGGLGIVAARAAFAELTPASAVAGALWHGHARHDGNGMQRACGKLDQEHISGHAAELHRWVSNELALGDAQAASLAAVTDTLGEWALDLRPVCEMPRTDAPSHVAMMARAAQTTDLALQRFATAFDAFYATLTEEQRTKLDGWFAHGHGAHS